MAIGETILKFTDYPFTYTIALLLVKINDIDPLSHEATPYLLGAGIAASVLVITDPFGRILKGWLMLSEKSYIKKGNDKENILKSWDDIKSVFHTQPIETEKDKIVSTIYFILAISFVMYLVNDYAVFQKYFNVFDQNNSTCRDYCLQSQMYYTLFITSIVVAGVGGWNGAHIFKKIRTMATYLICKNSPFVSSSSIQSMSDFIKIGDWNTAASWKEKVVMEYLREENFRNEREENLRRHIQVLLTKFNEFKKECDNTNFRLLMDPKSLNDPSKRYITIDKVFTDFPLYKNLISHLYTTENTEIFEIFRKYVVTRNRINQENEEWEKRKSEGIKNIVDRLSLKIIEKLPTGIRGEGDQWVNISRIRMDLDDFIITNRTTLIPIKNNPNSSLYQVRFFDSSASEYSRDDTIAELNRQDADFLNVELANIAVSLRESASNARTDFDEERKLSKLLAKKLEAMALSLLLIGDPLRGSCVICRNSRFFPELTIRVHLVMQVSFPYKLLGLEDQEI